MPTRPQARPQSERLRRKIELVLPPLVDASARLVAHPRARELYPAYLEVSHGFVRASVPLMEAAQRQALALGPGDRVAAALAAYLEEHCAEEAGHDEWLLQDLETLGRAPADVLAAPPSETVASFVGAQYYWIFHYHPVALLGYIALLEGYPPTAGLVDGLAAATGYGADAFRTLRLHAELDPGHREELDELLDRLPLSAHQSAAIGLSALFSARTLTRMIDELVEECEAAAA